MKRLVICLMALATMTAAKGQVIDTVLNKVSDKPFYFSVPVSDGNYKVTVTLGAKKRAAQLCRDSWRKESFIEAS